MCATVLQSFHKVEEIFFITYNAGKIVMEIKFRQLFSIHYDSNILLAALKDIYYKCVLKI